MCQNALRGVLGMDPKTLFEKFGHKCEIRSGLQIIGKISYRRRFIMMNETNRRGYNFLRSQKKVENEHRKHLQHPYIIHPFSNFRTCWDVIFSLILLLQFIMISLNIALLNPAYQKPISKGVWFIALRLFSDFISVVDIILTFCTGYCDTVKTTVILEPGKIARHFICGHLFIDVMSSIPLDVYLTWRHDLIDKFGHNFYFVMHYLCMIKIARYYTLVQLINNFAETLGIPYVTYKIGIALLSFLSYLHIICCLSIAWTRWDRPHYMQFRLGIDSLSAYGYDVPTFARIYVRMFYSSCLMIMNSGYSFPPVATPTYIFIINVWISSRILYIITLAYFMELHTTAEASTQKYIDMVNEVYDYMHHRQIPLDLQRRVVAYYDIKFQRCYFQESEILNTVSGQLRQEIIMNTCRKLVENVTFFKNLPLTLLVRIVSCLRYEIFLTNDMIAKAGSPGECMYFISTGSVAIYTKSGKEICHLHDGDHFGEIALVMKEAVRVATVTAAEVCELYRLDRRDFIRAILPYPDLFERVLYVAGDRMERTDILDEAFINQIGYDKGLNDHKLVAWFTIHYILRFNRRSMR